MCEQSETLNKKRHRLPSIRLPQVLQYPPSGDRRRGAGTTSPPPRYRRGATALPPPRHGDPTWRGNSAQTGIALHPAKGSAPAWRLEVPTFPRQFVYFGGAVAHAGAVMVSVSHRPSVHPQATPRPRHRGPIAGETGSAHRPWRRHEPGSWC